MEKLKIEFSEAKAKLSEDRKNLTIAEGARDASVEPFF
jgi:hypothetical protein